MPALSAAAMALFATKTDQDLAALSAQGALRLKGALMASVAGLSLTHTVGKAVWSGLFTSGKPFLRTPKCEDPALLQPGAAGGVAGDGAAGAAAGGDDLDGFDRGFEDPAVQLCGW